MRYGIQCPAGSLADRLSPKKPLAATGYALAALGTPIIGLVPVWPFALLRRSLDHLDAGIRSAPRHSLIASSVVDAPRGAAFGMEGIGDNLVSAPAGSLPDRFGHRPALFAVQFIFAAAYLRFAVSAHAALLALLFVGCGVYQGSYRAVGKAYTADLVPASDRAGGVGWNAAVMGVTGFAASGWVALDACRTGGDIPLWCRLCPPRHSRPAHPDAGDRQPAQRWVTHARERAT